MLVVPQFGAGLGVERIDVAERRRHEHDAVDDDRRRLHRFLDFGLEHPGWMQPPDVDGIDLGVGIVAVLLIIAVGVQEIFGVTGGRIKQALADRPERDALRGFTGGGLVDFLCACKAGHRGR